ncbi:hypothetical protein TNCV_926711 [Trichonephila clavipes]|nr:hypothetical protein TNCV_926711 [Trichonephila clavipes]
MEHYSSLEAVGWAQDGKKRWRGQKPWIVDLGENYPLHFDFSANRWCTCPPEQASPQHILDCLELDWEDVHGSPLLVSDFVKVKSFTNLV